MQAAAELHAGAGGVRHRVRPLVDVWAQGKSCLAARLPQSCAVVLSGGSGLQPDFARYWDLFAQLATCMLLLERVARRLLVWQTQVQSGLTHGRLSMLHHWGWSVRSKPQTLSLDADIIITIAGGTSLASPTSSSTSSLDSSYSRWQVCAAHPCLSRSPACHRTLAERALWLPQARFMAGVCLWMPTPPPRSRRHAQRAAPSRAQVPHCAHAQVPRRTRSSGSSAESDDSRRTTGDGRGCLGGPGLGRGSDGRLGGGRGRVRA